MPHFPRLILFNKPYGVLSQFTDRAENRPTLAAFIPVKEVYVAGRLDRDSEGLMALTDDGTLNTRIASPGGRTPKVYWAQVEGTPGTEALTALCRGVLLNDGMTLPAEAQIIPEPAGLWPRDPPIRYRALIPTTWLEIVLYEGRNRQVRRMTAAIGCPTLRLIRAAIGRWTVEGLAPGQWREVVPDPRESRPLRRAARPGSRPGSD